MRLVESQCIVALGLISTLFHLPVPNIEHFSTRRREGDVKVFVEVEQAQQQPTVAETFTSTSVTNFGNHVLRNDQENNQAFINEYEVNVLCMGKYCLELLLRYTYI